MDSRFDFVMEDLDKGCSWSFSPLPTLNPEHAQLVLYKPLSLVPRPHDSNREEEETLKLATDGNLGQSLSRDTGLMDLDPNLTNNSHFHESFTF